VLCTHLHVDHVGWNTMLVDRRWVPTFPSARYLMGRIEFDHRKNDRDPVRVAIFDDSIRPIACAGLMDLVDPGHDVCDELSLISTPGHSPGHICLYSPDLKVLFSGDHILNEITPNISWHPGSDALGDYLESLERVGRLEIEHIYPAHGAPFSGHREWIRETAAHHARRCDEIIAAVAGGANTAHEIVGRLWTRPLDPIHHHFAVFEVLAHLEYMQRQGRIRD